MSLGTYKRLEMDIKMDTAIQEVAQELEVATKDYGPMPSFHDGWAVIKEELDELWDEVRLKPELRSSRRLRKEAMQVAAMATRFMVDLTDAEEEG